MRTAACAIVEVRSSRSAHARAIGGLSPRDSGDRVQRPLIYTEQSKNTLGKDVCQGVYSKKQRLIIRARIRPSEFITVIRVRACIVKEAGRAQPLKASAVPNALELIDVAILTIRVQWLYIADVLVSLESELPKKRPHVCWRAVKILEHCLDRTCRSLTAFARCLFCLYVAYFVLLARILSSRNETGACIVKVCL